MDNVERAFEPELAAFRAAIDAATAPTPEPEPLWRSAATVFGAIVLYAIVAAAIVGGLAFAGAVARFGWEIAGGVGW